MQCAALSSGLEGDDIQVTNVPPFKRHKKLGGTALRLGLDREWNPAGNNPVTELSNEPNLDMEEPTLSEESSGKEKDMEGISWSVK